MLIFAQPPRKTVDGPDPYDGVVYVSKNDVYDESKREHVESVEEFNLMAFISEQGKKGEQVRIRNLHKRNYLHEIST